MFGTTAATEVRIPGGILPPKLGTQGLLLNGPVHLTADTLSYDEDDGVAVAEGNVELSLGNRTMRADRIRYDSRTGEADLTGKVRYKDADEEFAFDRITINLDSETGVLYNGSIRISTNNYLIVSEKISKTGKQSFTIDRGSLTTCPCDPEPDWKFDFRHTKVVLDGYAYARNITFRVRGVPVLWLPYGAFPVKLRRQSGLLLPSFSSDKTKGYTFSLPYYWAINRWSDATLTVDAMSRRGYRPEGEYRYVLNRESSGAIRGTFFRDKALDEERWRLYGENIFHSGEWTANAHVEFPSDNQYYVDLVDSDLLRSARHAVTTGFTAHSGENSSQGLSATWVVEMEQPNNDNTVQLLPEYSATVLPRRIPVGGIDASGEAAGTWFYRREGINDLRGRGSAALSRSFTLYPSISLTPHASVYFLGNRHEAFQGGGQDTGSLLPEGGVTLATEARKDWHREGEGYVHIVGSSVGYRYIPRIDQETVPVVDRWSRVAPQSQILLTTTQRFLGLKEGASPREMASLLIEWAYDVGGRVLEDTPYVDPLAPYVRSLQDQIDLSASQTPSTNAVSDIYAKLGVTLLERWNFQGEALFDPTNGTFSLGAVGGEWKKDEDHRIFTEYRVSQDLANDLRGIVVWRPLRVLRLHTEWNYSFKNAYLTTGTAGFTLVPRSDCWNVGLSVERKTQPDDTSVKLMFGLKGIGSVGN
jgi:LPS-assembly protein